MKQTRRKIEGPITDAIECAGFLYDLTEEDGYLSDSRRADYYRSSDCRYLICHVDKPIEDTAPNIYINDASIGNLRYDPITPSAGNWIFQGRVDAEALSAVINLLGIKNRNNLVI